MEVVSILRGITHSCTQCGRAAFLLARYSSVHSHNVFGKAVNLGNFGNTGLAINSKFFKKLEKLEKLVPFGIDGNFEKLVPFGIDGNFEKAGKAGKAGTFWDRWKF
jgi:hypothetical protein